LEYVAQIHAEIIQKKKLRSGWHKKPVEKNKLPPLPMGSANAIHNGRRVAASQQGTVA